MLDFLSGESPVSAGHRETLHFVLRLRVLSLTSADLVFLGKVAGRIRTERASELHSTARRLREEMTCSLQVGSCQGPFFDIWVWVGFLLDGLVGAGGRTADHGCKCSRCNGRDLASRS